MLLKQRKKRKRQKNGERKSRRGDLLPSKKEEIAMKQKIEGNAPSNIIEELKKNKNYNNQFVKIFEVPCKSFDLLSVPGFLHNSLQQYLLREDILSLFPHQIETINSIRDGENVIITTGTATGKTLSFNLPVLDYLLKNKNSTALYIYPTKALAHDQLKKINDILVNENIVFGAYDGDTPFSERNFLKKRAHKLGQIFFPVKICCN